MAIDVYSGLEAGAREAVVDWEAVYCVQWVGGRVGKALGDIEVSAEILQRDRYVTPHREQ